MPDLTQPATALVARRKRAGLAGLVMAAMLITPTGFALAQDGNAEGQAVSQPAAENTGAPETPATAAPTTPPAAMTPEAEPTSNAATPDPVVPTPATPAAGTDPVTPENATPSPAPSTAAPATPAAAAEQPAPEASLLDQFLTPERRSDLPHDLSPWGMFMAADWVVKAVMIGLAFASVVTWTIWFAKSVELACARARIRRALREISEATSLGDAARELSGRGGPGAFMVRSAEDEMRHSAAAIDYAGNEGVKERLVSRLARIEAQAGARMTKGTGALATIGSTAPFVGLFGTVWGIMNSFIGISQANTTNLAVVAPGIAEALLATAIGLVAAIPAVVIYNVFARSITGYRQLLTDAATAVERLVSRDLDYAKVPPNVRLAG